MATYLIGDIQGCYGPLQRLLDKIRFDAAADQLWLCGDLVNRGGQSLKVLRFLQSIRDQLVITLGNHDLYLLSEHARLPEGNSSNPEFHRILNASDRQQLMDWLRFQPMAHWNEAHQIMMVHAGVVPQWSVAQTLACAAEVEQILRSDQSEEFLSKLNKSKLRRWRDERTGLPRLRLISNILTRIRFCDYRGKVLWSASGPPGSQPKPYLPWYKHKNRQTRDVRVVFGHWAALGLRIKKQIVAMDSGCVWGGRLSAFRVEDERLFQVPGHYRSTTVL